MHIIIRYIYLWFENLLLDYINDIIKSWYTFTIYLFKLGNVKNQSTKYLL